MPTLSRIGKEKVINHHRDVARDCDFYNLDSILAVGYRVNSYQTLGRFGKFKPFVSESKL